jgi:hypothetical protein
MFSSSLIDSRIIFASILILSMSACSTNSKHKSASESGAGLESSEQLLAKLPPNWQLIYQFNNTSTRLSDFIPPGETETNWTTRLSFESFEELVDSDPIEILLGEVVRDQKNCSFVQHFNLFSGLENNFPASVRLFLCGENNLDDRGEVKLIKAIAGNDYFYLIRILKKIEPFDLDQPEFAKQEVAGWSNYLRQISLCDPTRPEHPCPE